MRKSFGKTGTLAVATILVVILVVAALGCSAGGESVDSPTPAGTAPAGTTEVGSSGTSPSTVLGQNSQEWAAKIPDLEDIVAADPTDLTALQNLAVAQYQARRYDDAAATYVKMLAIQDDPVIHNNYANVLRDAGKTNQAKAEYEIAIAGDASLTAAYLNLAVIYETEQNIPEAFKVLERGMASVSADDQVRLQKYKDKLIASTTST